MNLIIDVLVDFKYVLSWIWQVFIGFSSYLGLEDLLRNISIFHIILFVLSIFGTYLSIKNRRKLWTVICFLGDILGFIGVFISKSKSK